jgi:hypothetical protein
MIDAMRSVESGCLYYVDGMNRTSFRKQNKTLFYSDQTLGDLPIRQRDLRWDLAGWLPGTWQPWRCRLDFEVMPWSTD